MSPMDIRNYHPDWKWISRQIREQAGWRCEFCGLANGERGAWLKGEWFPESAVFWREPFRVVLTVAHLDHDPANNDPANLRALCQRCHNAWDVEHRKANRAETRRLARQQAPIAAGQTVMELAR